MATTSALSGCSPSPPARHGRIARAPPPPLLLSMCHSARLSASFHNFLIVYGALVCPGHQMQSRSVEERAGRPERQLPCPGFRLRPPRWHLPSKSCPVGPRTGKGRGPVSLPRTPRTGHGHRRSESLSGHPPAPQLPTLARGVEGMTCGSSVFLCISHQQPCSCNFSLLIKSSTTPTVGRSGNQSRFP